MTNTLFTNDNLFVLYGLNSEIADLIYLDPPFNSKRMYAAPVGSKAAGSAFKDMWTWEDVNSAYLETLVAKYPSLANFILASQDMHSKAMAAYLCYMAQRLIECHRVLKNTGSIYLHCDPTASHYLKGLMDVIFGRGNFRNEIVWWYKRWSNASKNFQRMHDVILFYTKSNKHTFNVQFQPDSVPEAIENTVRGVIDGKLVRLKNRDGSYVERTKENVGVACHDVFEIQHIQPTSKERTGYPTQKPLALLHRIIQASSNEGNVVLDPFCGCATTCVAAQQLHRKWIGIDIEANASSILMDRLSDDAGMFVDFVHRTDIPKRTDIAEVSITGSVKQQLFDEQNGLCNGCGTQFEIRHFEVDHIVPRVKGGGNYYENYQLLCGSCNRIKGHRPMEYLMNRLNVIERAQKRISFGG